MGGGNRECDCVLIHIHDKGRRDYPRGEKNALKEVVREMAVGEVGSSRRFKR